MSNIILKHPTDERTNKSSKESKVMVCAYNWNTESREEEPEQLLTCQDWLCLVGLDRNGGKWKAGYTYNIQGATLHYTVSMRQSHG